MFFVALFMVGIVSIAGGAIVVLLFVVRTAPAAVSSMDAGVTVVVPVASAASAAPDVAATPAVVPTAAASVVHPMAIPKATKPASKTGNCMCAPKTGSTSSLCPKEKLEPSHCGCQSVPGSFSLCPVPWTSAGCPSSDTFGKTNTAKDGDPCTGFNGGTKADGSYTNETLTGILTSCRPCTENDTYMGKIGAPCVGYRNERQPVDGVVDCSNLEFDCKRGDANACTALASHK